jgi:tRNA 5-methylaminomethyl-2-thiouridine biosynthesis bifunctional protein
MPTPFSTKYNDIYFSVHDGLAEKKYVFQQGNDLPARFENRSDFVIVEAGFGTGLSFLSTAQTFLHTTKAHQHLHFISFEKHPMRSNEIQSALTPWLDIIGSLANDMITRLPLRIPGTHQITLQGRLHLTLHYGDITDTIHTLPYPVDAWYLDGFTPAKNPDMWSDILFDAMKKWSSHRATAATYSAARMVRDGLERAGFYIQKVKGFGYKSDMVRATFGDSGHTPYAQKRQQRVVILGGGLAGTSAAWALKQAGHTPTIIAPYGLADGASGNPRGLYNPRFSPKFTDNARFFSTAFAAFYQFLSAHSPTDTGWTQNGALHLIRSDDTSAKLRGMVDTWEWESDHARIINAHDASTIAGIKIPYDSLWLPHAGSVSPKKLCALYPHDIDIRPDTPDLTNFDAVIVASGLAALNFPGLEALPLRPVRGQIITSHATAQSTPLKTNICYGGYITPADEIGTHVIGATFTRGDTKTDPRNTDTSDIISNMTTYVGPLVTPDNVIAARAGIRVTTPDHRPLTGRGPDTPNLPPIYLSLAHGSHGILSTFLAARHIASTIGSSVTI